MEECVKFLGELADEIKKYIDNDTSEALGGFYFGVLSTYSIVSKFEEFRDNSPKKLASVLVMVEQMVENTPVDLLDKTFGSFGAFND